MLWQSRSRRKRGAAIHPAQRTRRQHIRGTSKPTSPGPRGRPRSAAPDKPLLRVVDIERPPPPGPHEVLVSVEVSPVNKHDLLVVTGMLALLPLPHIPGAEGVARALATGAEVDGLHVGDLVVLPLYAGAWRERLVVPADGLFALPAGGSIEQYSMLGSNPPTAGLMLSEIHSPAAR